VSKSLLVPLGVLLVLVGILWTLQGVGYLTGSVMTGVRFWAVTGPIVIVAGVVLVIAGRRFRSGR
jgi:hypothetical protein